MNPELFRITHLDATHDRSSFFCGSEALDHYFIRQVSQDIKRNIATCFVALDSDDNIAGFYTLSSASIALTTLPDTIVKKLPRYPVVPAVRLGRLAVDINFRGKGLGGALLADAFSRVIDSDIGIYAMIVDAKDTTATDFYRHHGFIPFMDLPQTLFLPIETVKRSK
jgi:predicted GNAT family N-acyltransferase